MGLKQKFSHDWKQLVVCNVQFKYEVVFKLNILNYWLTSFLYWVVQLEEIKQNKLNIICTFKRVVLYIYVINIIIIKYILNCKIISHIHAYISFQIFKYFAISRFDNLTFRRSDYLDNFIISSIMNIHHIITDDINQERRNANININDRIVSCICVCKYYLLTLSINFLNIMTAYAQNRCIENFRKLFI